ncbi:hypothetical protein [Mycetocola reblochoni]|uniref:Uncharacterized protein n=2 Tax=Mycetocola reblochoni TaxID=331618 RepID=A0A1R4J3J7_9MICO|nr:hypothetical protein [Mycetocola reblochoni]RLP69501.1 hypothetical protein D9V30_06005 [Mycetocola reblochoni]SJN26617.1 hypothetical protein FM119_05125 [Mycetocola reblochoni REB411]
MKNAVWLIVGIVTGFVVAHQVNKSHAGHEFFAELDGRIREFTDSVSDAYNRREAELRTRDEN